MSVMDKEFKQGIKDIAQAQRLQEEEALHADNISRTIEYSEEVEEKEYQISQLQKKLRTTRGIIVAGVVALIIILLYMIYTISQPKEEVVIDRIPVQTVLDTKGVVFHLKEPTITLDEVDSTTLGDIKAQIDIGSFNQHQMYYLGEPYYTGLMNFPFDEATVVYELDDIKQKLASTPRVYEMEVLADPNQVFENKYSGEFSKMYLDCGVQYGDERGVIQYFNKEYLEYLKSFSSEDNRLVVDGEDIIAHSYFTIEIQLFDSSNYQGVVDAVAKALSENCYMVYEYDYSNNLPSDFSEKLLQAILEVDAKVNVEDLGYSYYTDMTYLDGELTGIHDGEREILSEQTTINITVEDLIYSLYSYLYNNGIY